MEFLRRLLSTASLHIKLMGALAVLVAVVTAGSATFLLEWERAQRLRELERRATRIADLLEQSLAQGLWNVDSNAIQRQLDALAPNPELAEVTVTAVGYGTVATTAPRKVFDAEDAVVRVRPIAYAQFEGLPSRTIGEVRVVLTRVEAEAAIARTRWVILAVAAAVMLTLHAATRVLLERFLRTPITRLEVIVDRLAAGDLDARCPVDSADELGRLAERVNVMADRLRGSTGQLRESEERFRTLVQFSFDVYWETDAQHRFTRQDYAEGLAEASPPGSEIGKTRWEVPYVEPDEEAWRKHRATLDAHLPFRDFEVARPTPAGGKRYVSVSGLPMFDETGCFMGYRGVGRHITDRKRSDQALRQSQAYLAEAERLTHLGSWAYNPATEKVTYWSDEAFRLFGLDPRRGSLPEWEELVRLVHPEDREGLAEPIASAIRGKTDFGPDFRIVLPDGQVRHLHATGHPVLDEGGNLAEYFGTVIDVTERKRAEDELRASEVRFRTLVDHATDALFLHDDHQTVIDVNRQACESLGYSRAELIGMRPRDFDASLDRVSIARVGERVTAGETVTFETLHRRKDGRVFPVEIRIRRFQQGDRSLHLALVRDISERKRVEQRTVTQHAVAQILAEAATIEEAAPRILEAVCECLDWDLGTLWRIDREAGVLRCMHLSRKASLDAGSFEAATRETAFAPGVGLPGRVWASRVPACIPDVVHDPSFLRASEAERAGLHAAFAFPILLGREVLGVIDFLSRDVRRSDQELLDLMASIGSQIGQFIERKRAEEALRVAHAKLTHLARVMTMGELTASIAHEVNQPLLGIVSSASSCSRWLAAHPPNLQRAQRALDRIMAAGTRASAVIDRVRTLVKREPLRAAPVDLNEIVRDVIAMVRQELQRSGVSLKTRLAEALPVVPGDRVQLQQVVLNLVLNAIEATRDIEGRSRQVWVASRFEGGKHVHVEIRDSGVGLAGDSRARVFETFYTTKETGLGMGLSISKSIVEAHGGRISAKPNSPHGAIFEVSLPLVSDTGVA
jgi:PAS domain S-box-containing protein